MTVSTELSLAQSGTETKQNTQIAHTLVMCARALTANWIALQIKKEELSSISAKNSVEAVHNIRQFPGLR